MEAGTQSGALRTDSVHRGGVVRRFTTETKQAFKTTEFWAFSPDFDRQGPKGKR